MNKTYSVTLFLLVSVLMTFAVTPYFSQDVFAVSPELANYTANNAGGTAGFNAGDTVTIRTDIATNATVATINNPAFITGNFTFGSPDILSAYTINTDYTAEWVNNTALVITFISTTNVPVVGSSNVIITGVIVLKI